MKHIKKFEAKSKAEIKKENDEIFQDLIDENPLSKDHDFYMFIGKDTFIENEDGSYKKGLEIENMVRMTKDTYEYSGMMSMRARFQMGTVYHIWLPVELRDEIEGNGSGSIPGYLIDLINKYKRKGGDEHGKQVYKDVMQRREDIDKYNL